MSSPVIRLPILGVIVVGGVIGVVLRELLLLPFAGSDAVLAVPTVTLVINIVGSFALGALVGRLGTQRPMARAFVGTGILGGFTTYSAFAVQTAALFSSAPIVGILFAVAAVVLGLLAAALGLTLVSRRTAPDEPVVDPGENS